MDYILGPKPETCVFCIPSHTREDEERYILYRGQWNFVIMNKYPYNNGHLMITPYRHLMNILDLTKDEADEQYALTRACIDVLNKAFNTPPGFNVGLNLGEAAGAGIREHIHMHVVPRWVGDSSFVAILDEVRVMPEHLATTYTKLKPFFDKLAHQ